MLIIAIASSPSTQHAPKEFQRMYMRMAELIDRKVYYSREEAVCWLVEQVY